VRLQGRTVLLVEDEGMVAMFAEDLLLEAGCRVRCAMRLPAALEMAGRETLDFAVLDINLGGDATSYPVAELLAARGIPFLFTTGYGGSGPDPRFADRPRLQKPYSPDELIGQALLLLGGSG
jgi:CheY-like chemotaxis protein